VSVSYEAGLGQNGDTDVGDAKFLMKHIGITTTEQAQQILDKYYPANKILPKTGYLIDEIVEEIRVENQCK